MSLEQLTTIDAINQFLDGTQAVAFNVAVNKKERYHWVQKTLVKLQYWQLGKAHKHPYNKALQLLRKLGHLHRHKHHHPRPHSLYSCIHHLRKQVSGSRSKLIQRLFSSHYCLKPYCDTKSSGEPVIS